MCWPRIFTGPCWLYRCYCTGCQPVGFMHLFIPATHWALSFIRTYALIIVIRRTDLSGAVLGCDPDPDQVIAFIICLTPDGTSGKQLSWLAKGKHRQLEPDGLLLALSVIWGRFPGDMRLQLNMGPRSSCGACRSGFFVGAVGMERQQSNQTILEFISG